MLKDLFKKIIPPIFIDWYHFILAFLGAVIYQFTSHLRQGFGGQAKKLKVIGVTGTNGKSTVVELTSKILEDAGYKVASLSSIRFKISEKEWPNLLKMTMPGRFQLQKFLRKAVNSGCQYVVLEVTSEGIKQYRHKFINFRATIFTNLAPEHIESHGGFENYRAAKGKLFQATKEVHILNLDDENAEYFLRFPAKEKYGYGLNARSQDLDVKYIKAENVKIDSSGIKFSVENTQFNLSLLGKFNIYNTLAAICVGLSQGVSLETCKNALERVEGIPGRMEEVVSQPFKVFVDYAFTPNALEKVYQTLATNCRLPTTRLICVLGAAGGGRDRWKRPILGEIARKYCQEIIITNEDPYDENPMEIIDQVAKGTGNMAKKFLDRREAIKESLKLAGSNDVIIITGKGCEPWICVERGKKIPWDDREIVKEEFKRLKQ